MTINAGGQTGVVTLIGTNTYGLREYHNRLRRNTPGERGNRPADRHGLVLNGGVFERSMTRRPVSLSTATSGRVTQVRLIGGSTRAGFSVFEGTLNVQLNNGTAAVTWGTPNFNPGILVLGTASPTENNVVILENAIDLGGTARTISAEGFGFANSSYSQITGISSNGGLIKQGAGILELTATNTYTGRTTISAGVLRANSGQEIHTNSAITINGGVLENRGGPVTFARNVGTAAGQVELVSGGFSAFGGTMTVQLNGSTGTVAWGSAGFFATGGAMRLGSASSDSLVNFTNGINLGSAVRTVEVDGNPVSSSALARLSGPISGSGGLTIHGNGVSLLELTGANAYTGETRVFEGTLRANHGQGLPAASPLFLDDGGILEGLGAVTFSRSLGNGGGQVRLSGNSGFSATGGAMTVQLNGGTTPVTWGTTNFIPTGSGPLVLGSLSANNLVDFQNALDLGGATRAVLVYDNAAVLTDRGRISGAISNGGLTKGGSGVLELTGANTYSGPTAVVGGVLRANDGTGLPTGSALLINNLAVLESIGATAFTRTVGTGAGQVQIGSGGGGFSASGGAMVVQLNGGTGTVVWGSAGLAGPLVLGSAVSDNLVDFQNGIDLDGGTLDLYANGGQARLSGVITNGGINQLGPGSLELTAPNTYAGNTAVLQGRLVVNNATGSATGTGAVSLQFGAALAGGGRIAGVAGLTVNPGSRIEPGGAAGRTLTVQTTAGNPITINGAWAVRIDSVGTGGVALNSGASTNGTLPNPTNHTFLSLAAGGQAGNVVLGTFATWEIDGTGMTFLPSQRYSYVIGRTGAGEVAAGTISDQLRFTTIGFVANNFSLTTLADGRIILNFTPVPEPATVLGIAAAGLGFVGLVRRRRR